MANMNSKTGIFDTCSFARNLLASKVTILTRQQQTRLKQGAMRSVVVNL